MEDQEVLKMNFLNENIIEKGMDPEQFFEFIKKKTNEEYDSLPIDKIKELFNEFNKGDTNDDNNKEEKNEKKEEEGKENEKEKEEVKDEIKDKSKEEEKKKDENEKKEVSKEEEKKKDEKINEKEEKKEIGKEKEKIKEESKKETKQNNPLYTPQEYEFKTSTQQKNKLLELSENNKIITIIVSEPKKEQVKGFFTKTLYSYRVQCPELNSDVRRTYLDFEWIRNQLVLRYPLRLIPPVMKESVMKTIGNIIKQENEEITEQRKIRYLNTFMNAIIQKKILRTSPILFEFLSLDTKVFKLYQEKIAQKKYELDIKLTNLITTKGKVKCALDNKSMDEANNIGYKYTTLSEMYNKINSSFDNIINDFQNLSIHMKEVSNNFNALLENMNYCKYTNLDDFKNNITELKNTFNNWSLCFGNQSDYFNKQFKENFNYMALEVDEMNLIFKKYYEFKNEYEEFSSMINKKKEDLFNSKNYSKWDVEPGQEKEIPTYKDNKKLAFEKMLYKENILLKEEKKRVCATIHIMKKQYNKLMKLHNKKVNEINDSMKKKVKIDFITE